MSLYKFNPEKDITTYELALVVKSFFLAMHGEGPSNNLELEGYVVDFLVQLDPEMARHFQSVADYD